MKKKIPQVLPLLVRKALQSRCRFNVSAIAFDKRGNILGTAMNVPRFGHVGGSVHAEMSLMKSLLGIRTILICRCGNHGSILPIKPCPACKRKAEDLGIKIVSVREE